MRRCRAFTLMELLIAVSIFSIIALCLYSTFAGGIRIWQRQEKGFKYSHNARFALDKMAKELRNAINYSQPEKKPGEGIEEGQGLRFSGDEKGLTFITLIGTELARVDYVFDITPDRKGVLRRRVSLQKEGFKEENQEERIAIEGIENLIFEYAYKEDKEDAEHLWQRMWTSETQGDKPKLPIGLRITLEFTEPGRKENEILKKTIFIPTGSLEEYKGS